MSSCRSTPESRAAIAAGSGGTSRYVLFVEPSHAVPPGRSGDGSRRIGLASSSFDQNLSNIGRVGERCSNCAQLRTYLPRHPGFMPGLSVRACLRQRTSAPRRTSAQACPELCRRGRGDGNSDAMYLLACAHLRRRSSLTSVRLGNKPQVLESRHLQRVERTAEALVRRFRHVGVDAGAPFRLRFHPGNYKQLLCADSPSLHFNAAR